MNVKTTKVVTVISLYIFILSSCKIFTHNRYSNSCSGYYGNNATKPISFFDSNQVSYFEISAVDNSYLESSDLSLFYLFDDAGNYEFITKPKETIKDQEFKDVEGKAFWGEVVDGSFYSVPELGKCMIQGLFQNPISFNASKDGFLIIHIFTEGCSECDNNNKLIKEFIRENNNIKINWVQLKIPEKLFNKNY